MSSRRRLARKESRAQLVQKLRDKCPRCGKTCAATEEEAWAMARRQYARHGGEMPKRVYSCSDDGKPPFHWTRQERYVPEYQRLLQEEYAREQGEKIAEHVSGKPVHMPESYYSEEHWL